MRKFLIVSLSVSLVFAAAACSKTENAAPSVSAVSGANASTTTAAGKNNADAPTTKPSGSPSVTLSTGGCLDLSLANLDLATATTTEKAEAAAKKLMALNPPATATAAIQILVRGPGLQFNDSGKTADATTVIATWMNEVCPT